MKYLRRSLKYLIQISLIFVLVIGALMATGMVSKDVTVAFRNGWTSLGWIALMFVLMSAAYPAFGYGKRKIRLNGDPAELWPRIDEAMAGRAYVKVEEGKYQLASPLARAARLWEDGISITPVLGGLEAEGLVRDLSRVVMTLDHQLNRYE